MIEKKYEKLMRKCINLAKKSEGRTSPNPLVGAIIFDDDFRIISTGRHEYYGGNHAERNAVLSAKEDLKGKSIIVNLEPCSHYGKTPPCANLLIEKGFKRVIAGMVDPNPEVAGQGIERLKKAGIEVVVGVLEDECRELNKIFLKNQYEKMPYITIKTATTLDGKIATKTGDSKWITDEASRAEVQKLRNKYDAILTSSQTVIKDNPSLTCRKKGGRNPIRVILDTNLTTSVDSKVYNNDGTRVILITSKEANFPPHVEVYKCPTKNNHIDLIQAVKILYDLKIRSILIEAGGALNQAFIEAGLVDDLVQFVAPKILGDKSGINFVENFERKEISQCNNLSMVSVKKLKNDIMIVSNFIK
ncbi:MAG: bifunctional diaminohydroxyphosphoribosylaminopyrimidine deaminase/5-amino-6-(5-phosphoribosylamino)uracil reductase RibD [Cyanobacteria bacterium SIG29]|nr:bifunctional diaminohydroxyphosphoribosylaminopyrimidine deaminase/5-amino-6-(5-phosphoribosylamino)uracil reductase RibD [Cyanobacteria bacterium SIG29]